MYKNVDFQSLAIFTDKKRGCLLQICICTYIAIKNALELNTLQTK